MIARGGEWRKVCAADAGSGASVTSPIRDARMTSAAPHIRVELLSNPLYLSGVRELVSSVAKRIGFHEKNCTQIALAVDEALCNVMRHGYDKRTDGPIWVSVWHGHAGSGSREPTIRIMIEDEAKQVEPTAIKGRALDDIKPGGLGVHIIREVMDSTTYEKRSGGGMRLTMEKAQRPEDHVGNAEPGMDGRGEANNSCGCGGPNA